MQELIDSEFTASARLLQETAAFAKPAIVAAAELLIDRLKDGSKVLLFGNGGSAADAQHFAAELVARFRRERVALPAIALTTDTSLLTAIANDYSMEVLFSRQVQALAQPGDVVIGLTTSGQSANVIAGLSTARQLGSSTIALCGKHTAPLEPVTNIIISVPSRQTAHIQEAHGVIIHILCELIDRAFSSQQEAEG